MQNHIDINRKNQRDSNMELLRILAMILVMIVHANFRALSSPNYNQSILLPESTLLRLSVESIAIVCVNTFILLSGWYGINRRISKLSELIFQVLFYGIIGFTFIKVTSSPTKDESALSSISHIFILHQWDYWFIKCYVGLYILSPLLNYYINRINKKDYILTIILFYGFQTLFGWIAPSGAAYIECGYSTFSFIGLYILARYAHLYQNRIFNLNKIYDLLIYISTVIINTTLSYLLIRNNIDASRVFLYTNPIIIIGSLYLLLFFSKLKIRSKLINWISISCLSIYLVHSNYFIASPFYDNIIKNWFLQEPRIVFISYTSIFIILIFILSISIDKIRILIWKCIYKYTFNQIKIK